MKIKAAILSNNNLLERTLRNAPELSEFDFETFSEMPKSKYDLLLSTENALDSAKAENILVLSKPLDVNYAISELLNFTKEKDVSLGTVKFNYRKKLISNNIETLNLTEVETNLFQSILNSPEMSASKNNLIQDVLGYSKDAETKTLENHLYKLKAKLKELGAENLLSLEGDKITISAKT